MLLNGGFAAGTHREKSKSDRNRCQGNLTARAAVEKAVPELFAVSSLEHFARTNKLLGEIPFVVTRSTLWLPIFYNL